MQPTQPVYDYVLERVFGVFLSAPDALQLRLDMLDRLDDRADRAQTSITITPQGLLFSLPKLYAFAILESEAAYSEAAYVSTKAGKAPSTTTQSYESFRRCLYGQQTQVALRALGGEVVIADNLQHVDESIYRLQPLTL